MQFRPFGAVDYIYIGEAGYRERGANSINMVVRNKESTLMREEVGFSFSSWQTQEDFSWSEELKVSYVHEERFKGKHTRLRFAGSSDRFEVSGFLLTGIFSRQAPPSTFTFLRSTSRSQELILVSLGISG